jgi:hypothetical protein
LLAYSGVHPAARAGVVAHPNSTNLRQNRSCRVFNGFINASPF